MTRNQRIFANLGVVFAWGMFTALFGLITSVWQFNIGTDGPVSGWAFGEGGILAAVWMVHAWNYDQENPK